ncbi:unnamed protein product [Discula destructiva]
MVLARAFASSRATTLSRRSFLACPTLTLWQRQCPIVAVEFRSGHSRRQYADSALGPSSREHKNLSEQLKQLLDALASLEVETQRLASAGTPEQRQEAQAKIDESNKIIALASPLQRRTALSLLQEELSSLADSHGQPPATESAPRDAVPLPEAAEQMVESDQDAVGSSREGTGTDLQQPVEAGESARDLTAEEVASQNVEDVGFQQDEISGTGASREPVSLKFDLPSGDTYQSVDDWINDATAPPKPPKKPFSFRKQYVASATVQRNESWTSSSQGLAFRKQVMDQPFPHGFPTGRIPGTKKIQLKIAFQPNDPEEQEPPAYPDDPRKWELITPEHPDYPDLAKEDQERLLIIRRTQDRRITRTVDKVWLRNACKCDACIDPSTGWKNFNITSVPDELPTGSTEFNATTGGLEVEWENDFLTKSVHKSSYPPEVFEFFYRPKNQAGQGSDGRLVTQSRMLWDAQKLQEHRIRIVEYSDWQAHADPFKAAMESIHVQGVALVRGTQDVSIEDVASQIGAVRNTPWGSSWETGHEPHPRYPTTADTGVALGPETSSPWLMVLPRLIFLQCLDNTVEGGEVRLVDGLKTVYDMQEFDAGHTAILSHYSFRFRFADPKAKAMYRNRRPCHYNMSQGNVTVRLNQKSMEADPLAGPGSSAEYTGARRALNAWVKRTEDPANIHELNMKKGDCLIIDAWRILLGRNAFDPESGHRRFRAATMDFDEWSSCVNALDSAPISSSSSPTAGRLNRGQDVGTPYSTQVWLLAGLDPADQFKKAPLPLVPEQAAVSEEVTVPADTIVSEQGTVTEVTLSEPNTSTEHSSMPEQDRQDTVKEQASIPDDNGPAAP